MSEFTADDTTILVIGNHYYGAGHDLADAKREFQRQGGTLSRGYEIVTFGPGCTYKGVDQMGRYFWDAEGAEPTTKVVQPREQARR